MTKLHDDSADAPAALPTPDSEVDALYDVKVSPNGASFNRRLLLRPMTLQAVAHMIAGATLRGQPSKFIITRRDLT